LSVPLSTTPHVCATPVDIWMTLLRLLTWLGGLIPPDVEVLPSWLSLLSPQQATVWSARRAHVNVVPVDIDCTFASEATDTGWLRLASVPSPSCPLSFKPQHLTVPSATTAHVWLSLVWMLA
jgi:hypothetical protein